MPISTEIVQRSVFTFCRENNVEVSFNKTKRMAGRKCFYLFKKRNPRISLRKAQHMNPGRAMKLNRVVVSDYFEKLQTVLTMIDAHDKPQLIYNMDEKGCRLALHKQQKVLAERGSFSGT